MGCRGSKLDDLQAVALCRDRSRLLADAIRARRALADAHAAYARSLRSVGAALRAFLDVRVALPDASPVLPLPTSSKAEPSPPPSPTPPASAAARHFHSRSHSGSDIHFHSSESESDSEPVSPCHSSGSSPVHEETMDHSYVNISYARSRHAAPCVLHEQRPQSSEPVQHHFSWAAEPSATNAYPSYGYPYPAQNSDSYSYAYSYPSAYPPDYSGYGGMNAYFGSSPPPPPAVPLRPAMLDASPSSRVPPTPPSPPRASSWDFPNPFESYDSFYAPYNAAYTPSRCSKEVREEEGIPELEEDEEEEECEVVKEGYREHRKLSGTTSVAAGCSPRKSSLSSATDDEGEVSSNGESLHGPLGGGTGDVENSTRMLNNNVVAGNVGGPEGQRNVAAPCRYGDVAEVLEKIEAQFNRASESTDEVSRILGVGKLPYHHINAMYKVSSSMMSVATLSLLNNEEFLDFEDNKKMGSRNLSDTLQKIYMWEKKLHEEVRAEENMRKLHDKCCRRLQNLDQKGAEVHKIDSIRARAGQLSTRIRIAIKVVDSISNRIHKLRDEELWPQICELIQGLMRMWRIMLECHRTQFQAILEAKSLDSKSSGGKLSDAHMEAAKQLELEVLEWVNSFSAWIYAQRSYIKVMNGWLLKCIYYEPEETPDGITPFSPGRLGAPPVFVICNYWSQAMDKVSEGEVVDSMRSFAANVLQLWQQHHFELHQRVLENGDMDKAAKILEKEEEQVRRAVDAQGKKLVPVSSLYGEVVHHGHKDDISSLQLSLRQIFEAMENFTANFMKIYEELYMLSEEEWLARGNAKVP